MKSNFEVHYGNPWYWGPPTQERIREIFKRYLWDEYNQLGYGCGVIYDTIERKPIK